MIMKERISALRFGTHVNPLCVRTVKFLEQSFGPLLARILRRLSIIFKMNQIEEYQSKILI